MGSGPWPRSLGGLGSGLSKWAPRATEMRSEPRPQSRPESGPEAHTWEVPNAWCRCVPLTVQPASPDVTFGSGLFIGAGQEEIPSPSNIIPGWLHPGPQAPGVESRYTAGLTVVGLLYSSRLSRSNKHTGRGGVVISSIKYSPHPDIRSLLSLFWLVDTGLYLNCKVTKNNHEARAQACVGINTHVNLSHCDINIKEWRITLVTHFT